MEIYPLVNVYIYNITMERSTMLSLIMGKSTK